MDVEAIRTAKEEGREEEKKGMASKMIAKGMSIQDVSELTGLTVEGVQALKL